MFPRGGSDSWTYKVFKKKKKEKVNSLLVHKVILRTNKRRNWKTKSQSTLQVAAAVCGTSIIASFSLLLRRVRCYTLPGVSVPLSSTCIRTDVRTSADVYPLQFNYCKGTADAYIDQSKRNTEHVWPLWWVETRQTLKSVESPPGRALPSCDSHFFSLEF